MKTIKVQINKTEACVAGLGNEGSLTITLHWSRFGDIDLGVGGLDSATGEHLRWSVPELKNGDEVSFLLIEGDLCDPPTTRKTENDLLEEERRFLENFNMSNSPNSET